MASRPVRSCTECKQAKLRCDSKKRFPNPCSRCNDRNLVCTVDISFKRTPTRRRLQALNQELQALRSQYQSHDVADRPSRLTTAATPADEAVSWDFAPDDLALDLEMVLLDVSTELPAAIAVEAFDVFVKVFRPQLPILGPISMRTMHRSQPLLFWTVIIIVATHSPGPVFDDVIELLRRPYTAMLERHVLQAPLPLHAIQALLLLCQWPLPCDNQSRDPSWLYCGLAVHGARFMGLDRPHHEQPATAPSLASLGVSATSAPRADRINTWLACFAVSASLGLHLGLPPPIHSDLDLSGIHAALPQAAATFASQVKIQLVAVKFISLLSHDMGSPGLTSTLRLADIELKAAKTEASALPTEANDADPDRLLELAVLSVWIHLYALVIAKSQQARPPASPDPIIHVVLTSALDVAIRFIDLSTWDLRTAGYSGNGPPSRPQHQQSSSDAAALRTLLLRHCLPKNHFRCLALATAILLRFFRERPTSLDGNRTGELPADLEASVANRIAVAQRFVKACARHPLDEFGRAATVFEALAAQQHQQTTSEEHASSTNVIKSPRLQVTQRMGVSILLDSITRSHQARGRAVHVEDEESSLDETGQTLSRDSVAAPFSESELGHIMDLESMWGLPNGPFSSIMDMEPAWFEMGGNENNYSL